MDNMEKLEQIIEPTAQEEPLAEQEATESQNGIELVSQEADAQKETKEPGWIRQRVDKAVSKAVRETEERLRAQYEQMLSPLRESIWDREAERLVQDGEFKTLETAKEYVRLKNGAATQPSAAIENQPARDERGRFTSQAEDPIVKARSEVLATQVQKIAEKRGINVMDVFNGDPQVRQRVLSGEWDFYDVADAVSRRSMPSPNRAANGAQANAVSVANMTQKQFAQLQSNLDSGKVYDLRR